MEEGISDKRKVEKSDEHTVIKLVSLIGILDTPTDYINLLFIAFQLFHLAVISYHR